MALGAQAPNLGLTLPSCINFFFLKKIGRGGEGGETSSRPQMKEKVAMMETQTNASPLPYFPPVVTLPAATTGYFRLKNKALDLFEQLLFHRSRSRGACGRPGLGHFPRELTRFPFSAKVQFSNSVWPLLASPFPGWAVHGQGARGRAAGRMGMCLDAFLVNLKGRPGSFLRAPPPPSFPQSHTRNLHCCHQNSTCSSR